MQVGVDVSGLFRFGDMATFIFEQISLWGHGLYSRKAWNERKCQIIEFPLCAVALKPIVHNNEHQLHNTTRSALLPLQASH